MKKFVITVAALVVLYIGWDFAYYRLGWYVNLHSGQEVSAWMEVRGDQIYRRTKDGMEPFEIRGMYMGSGIPGEWFTDFSIDKETYLRWFEHIQAAGANVIRIYTIQSDDFYEAFYEYSINREQPLYLFHGVLVNDYIQNSHRDAYATDFLDVLLGDCRTVVDVLHGNKKISLGRMTSAGSGFYRWDISQWGIGYILGVEWEDVTVVYTDEKYEGVAGYTS